MSQTALHRFCLATAAFFLLGLPLHAQSAPRAEEVALRFLQNNPSQFNLDPEDVSDVRITDAYVSKHNSVTHVWVQQQYAGIPVFNGLFGLHVKPDGSVLHLGHRFVQGLGKQVNTTLPSLGAAKALELAMADLGFSGFTVPGVKSKINDRNWIFETGAISRSDIPVGICYALSEKGQLRLAWNIGIDQANTADLWTILVDAQSGQILNKINQTVYCQAGHVHRAGEDCSDDQEFQMQVPQAASCVSKSSGGVDETYNVFALPVESPAHGGRQLVVNPADAIASPYGWLDTDGAAGADYTYSRGNNVWAFDDSASDDTPAQDESADGGATLTFDFPYDANAEPEMNAGAAITNLFYLNNMMHDIFYNFGFDEVSGNFQTNNYGHGGKGSDAVLAQALDGGGTDNANFSTPADGGPGRMQMYKWGRQGDKIVKVNAPGALLGNYSANVASGWGGAITTTPVTGDAVFTDDGSGTTDATKNCNPPVNDLQGKIAMIERGVCEFGRKALTAQQAGAIGCIICGFDEQSVSMGAGTAGSQVTIPTVYMTKSNCDIIRQAAGNGLNISLVIPAAAGPNFLDGDFDNGIIAHEYGHGISNRLTGGPNQSGCLGNAEQMGEGWSDWFSLVTSVHPGDVQEKKRGVGTYVFRQPNDGQGIRRYPYSTDMSINPITYATVAANTEVHALGEIWTAVTWDLYWAMVEKYGYDQDLSNKTSGNARAIQLVMDGMKLQPCSPGFLDGRDGIMAADLLNYNGVDTCLIMSVFARRGMGVFASQGSSASASDGVENFDPIPTCIKELKITKETSTPIVESGENAEFTITVVNHKDEAITNVVVTDPLPAGLSLVSASNGGVDNSGVVTWNLGAMASGEIVVLTYTAKVDPSVKSTLYYRDDMEEEGDSWISYVLNDEGFNVFYLQSDDVKVGNFAWKADSPDTETDQALIHYDPAIKVSGDNPVLRFWHKYQTEKGADAGFLEIQLAGDPNWNRLAPEKIFRDGYSSSIQYGTFAIPNISGFSGNSNGWVRSYVDLSDYAGKDILYRFRFGTDANTAASGDSWIVDQVDLIDMVNYDTEACASSNEGDYVCANAPARGVIIDADAVVGTNDPQTDALGMRVQPNPVSDLLTLQFGQAAQGPVQVTLLSADGRVALRQQTISLYAGQVITLDVQNLPAGMYVVRVDSSAGSSVAKVAKK